GTARDTNLPDVPTMAESGYPQVGFHPDVWQAFVAPAATPSAVINKLNAEVNETLKSTEVKANLDRLGFDPMIMSPREFAAFLAAQAQKWPSVTQAAKFHPP